jgi:4-hydroxy-tetrahydrodipicolinate synthase
MNNNIFKGVLTALITPLKNNLIDFSSLKKLIDLQINAGIDGIVIGGSTGEGNSLSDEEYNSLVKFAVSYSDGRIPIIASISTTSTQSAVKKIKDIELFDSKPAISGLMCTVPHYIRPTQQGVIDHFSHIHDTTDLPIMIYIHPGRTGIDLEDETIIQLTKFKRIIAIKDAGNDINRPLRLLANIPDAFNMLTGNDENVIAYASHGGRGCVSVISNLFPNQAKQIQNFLTAGKFNEALEVQKKLLPLYETIFSEPNPIGIKHAASIMGLCDDEIRLPLTKALSSTKKVILSAINRY